MTCTCGHAPEEHIPHCENHDWEYGTCQCPAYEEADDE